MFDVNRIRKDFPILEEKIYGKPLVYLDNGATTQRPLRVVEKMTEYYLRYNSNVHRGVHYLSNKCTDANEQARETVREFINAESTDEEPGEEGSGILPKMAKGESGRLLSGKVTRSS